MRKKKHLFRPNNTSLNYKMSNMVKACKAHRVTGYPAHIAQNSQLTWYKLKVKTHNSWKYFSSVSATANSFPKELAPKNRKEKKKEPDILITPSRLQNWKIQLPLQQTKNFLRGFCTNAINIHSVQTIAPQITHWHCKGPTSLTN